MSIKGIDVSKHNGKILWNQVKASGIGFTICRAGYGNNISQKDSTFDYNITNALANGIKCGAYWFSYAISPADAIKEADVFLKILEPYRGKLVFPVAFDYEYDSITYSKKQGVNPDKKLITDIAIAFMNRVRNAGWYIVNYTNLDFIRNKFDMTKLKNYPIWLADYTGSPDVNCQIQQTGSTGKVYGIGGNVDMNTAFVDYKSTIVSGGYNGYTKPQSTIVGIDTTCNISFAHGAYYTVKTTSIKPVKLTYGTSDVVTIVPLPRVGNDQLFAIVAIGDSGKETGIFTCVDGENPTKRFKFKIK